MWSVTNYFLLNLTISDIMMATLNTPVSFMYMRDRCVGEKDIFTMLETVPCYTFFNILGSGILELCTALLTSLYLFPRYFIKKLFCQALAPKPPRPNPNQVPISSKTKGAWG